MERRQSRQSLEGRGVRWACVYLGRVFMGVALAILSNEAIIIAWQTACRSFSPACVWQIHQRHGQHELRASSPEIRRFLGGEASHKVKLLCCPHWKPASTVRRILLQNCHIPISLGKCLSHGIMVFSTILPGIQGPSLQDCPMHPRLGFTHFPFCDMKVSVRDSLTALYSVYGPRILV